MDEKTREEQVDDEGIVEEEIDEIEVSEPDEKQEVVSDATVAGPAEPEAQQAHEPSIMNGDFVTLFREGEAEDLRARWLDVQSRFVDDPRTSVEAADQLVDQIIKGITDTFARERARLEDGWNSEKDGITTEDLRLVMRRYRSFFDRLLKLEI